MTKLADLDENLRSALTLSAQDIRGIYDPVARIGIVGDGYTPDQQTIIDA